MLEFLKESNRSVLYHPDKANVVAKALSRMTMGSVAHVDAYTDNESPYVFTQKELESPTKKVVTIVERL